MPDLNFQKYTKLLDEVPSVPSSPPPAGQLQGPPQMNDGTTLVREPQTGEDVATSYVETIGGVPDEQWVVFDEARYLKSALVCTQTTALVTRLDQPALDALLDRQATTGAKYSFTSFPANYYQMPSEASVKALPDTNPPAVTGVFVYDVRSIAAGTTGFVSGQLYRELLSAPGHKTEYRDHWVFFDTYFAPAEKDTISITPSTDPNRPTTLEQFLTAMRARYLTVDPNLQGSWRYSPVVYTFGPLPTKAP